MSGLRADMSGVNQICSIQTQICSTKQVNALWKSRSGAKMINLGLNKLTAAKLNTIELREIKGTTRSNLNTRNHT
jgi:hypothetical protein